MLKTSSILVLASHSAELLKSVCSRGIVLDNGQMVFDGGVTSALDFYREVWTSPKGSQTQRGH